MDASDARGAAADSATKLVADDYVSTLFKDDFDDTLNSTPHSY